MALAAFCLSCWHCSGMVTVEMQGLMKCSCWFSDFCFAFWSLPRLSRKWTTVYNFKRSALCKSIRSPTRNPTRTPIGPQATIWTWWFLQGPQKINFLLFCGQGPHLGPYGPQSGGSAPHTPTPPGLYRGGLRPPHPPKCRPSASRDPRGSIGPKLLGVHDPVLR